jgi:hypothetical protein
MILLYLQRRENLKQLITTYYLLYSFYTSMETLTPVINLDDYISPELLDNELSGSEAV